MVLIVNVMAIKKTEQNREARIQQPLLLEAAVSSDLNKFVEESVQFANRHPALLAAVQRDLDVHGLRKKHARQADQHFLEAHNAELSGLDLSLPAEMQNCSCVLEGGRPRMPALLVFIFLLLRGWIGGPKGTRFKMLLKESITLHRLIESLSLERMPGPSTVLDNINAVSEITQQKILSHQLALAAEDGLDDLNDCRADSTSVKPTACIPPTPGS